MSGVGWSRRRFLYARMGPRSGSEGDHKLITRIRAYLWTLGATPEEVAAALGTQGVRGKRHSAASCPLAVGLARHLGDYLLRVEVVGGVVRVSNRLALWHHKYNVPGLVYNGLETPLAASARTFAARFDAGDFDALLLVPEAAREESPPA